MSERIKGVRAYSARSHKELERVATDCRARLAPLVACDEQLDVLHFFERLHHWKVKVGSEAVDLLTRVDDMPRGVHGVTQYSPEHDAIEVVLSTTTYDGLMRDVPMDRFTACHEIGHAVLHAREVMELSRMPHDYGLRRGGADFEVYRCTEWQANAFASKLLMPEEGLRRLDKRGLLEVAAVEHTFGVSRQAAQYRIEQFMRRG